LHASKFHIFNIRSIIEHDVGQKKLKSGSVLVVGLGGLGSPSSMFLAAAGIGKIFRIVTLVSCSA